MREKSKKEEEKHILAFWECLEEFPGYVPKGQDPPEPDFYVVTGEGKIGIEHTRLIRQKDQRGFDPKRHDVLAQKIIEYAENEFNLHSDVKLHVDVDFRNDYGLMRGDQSVYLTNADIKQLADRIAGFVKANIPDPKTHVTFEGFDENTGKRLFSEKIERITIANTDYKNASCWSATSGGVLPRVFESSAFTSSLKKKNDKPKNYQQNYYQIWLLMVDDDREFVSSFSYDRSDENVLDSPFDRVFIFRYALDKIIELKVNKVA